MNEQQNVTNNTTPPAMQSEVASYLSTEELQINLSDFALFLSVMKNQTAHELILSILLAEPDLKLKKVHVEEVVLNKNGNRAIRLDAWALSNDRRQFATEMQNDTENDDVRKRSRYYQGLLDTPILKAGKQTRYKDLPSTVVTFITQKDIFHKDQAKYTFTERCLEFPELELEDGTTKIFLNMTSKNGSPELISLLQYMKDTRADNPEIVYWDERLSQIDQIVNEVKQSEEWEGVQMSILSIGLERGEAIGLEKGQAIGLEKGQAIGLEKGQFLTLINQIIKKMKRGLSSADIADALETDLKTVDMICSIAQRYAPEYDTDKICNAYLKQVAK